MARLTSMIALLAALAGAASCKSNTGQFHLSSYVKRHPDFTREEFWAYWRNQHAPKVVPLATYFNITRYQQVQVGGKIVPTAAGSDVPESNELVDFDGIALFLYESAEVLTAFLAHPYYIGVVEPDERVFIDKNAFGGGQVASYIGYHVDAVDNSKDVWIGDDEVRVKYQTIFDSYQAE